MPLVRYEIRSEYELANRELYRTAPKNDPGAILEGVAMVSLVGIVRQLGDLAEFAADVFHDLHEAVMATASRSHDLILRVSQLEGELPAVEKALFSKKTNHLQSAYAAGTDWHASIRSDQNHCTQGDLPRFIRSSYEECRGPPMLFMLDKFDIQGAGACLKRYTDPSFFKMEWASSELSKAEKAQQQHKKARRGKKKARNRKDGIADAKPAVQFQPRMRYSSLSLSSIDGMSENTAPLSAMVVESEQLTKAARFSSFLEASSHQSSAISVATRSPKSVRKFALGKLSSPVRFSSDEPVFDTPDQKEMTADPVGITSGITEHDEGPRESLERATSEAEQYLDAMTTMESETDSEPRERRRFYVGDIKPVVMGSEAEFLKAGDEYEKDVFYEDTRNSTMESETESKFSAELTPIPVEAEQAATEELEEIETSQERKHFEGSSSPESVHVPRDIEAFGEEQSFEVVEDFSKDMGFSEPIQQPVQAEDLPQEHMPALSIDEEGLPEIRQVGISKNESNLEVLDLEQDVEVLEDEHDQIVVPESDLDEDEDLPANEHHESSTVEFEQDETLIREVLAERNPALDGGEPCLDEDDVRFDVEVIQVINTAPKDEVAHVEDSLEAKFEQDGFETTDQMEEFPQVENHVEAGDRHPSEPEVGADVKACIPLAEVKLVDLNWASEADDSNGKVPGSLHASDKSGEEFFLALESPSDISKTSDEGNMRTLAKEIKPDSGENLRTTSADDFESASSEDVFMDPEYQSSSRFSDGGISDDYRDSTEDQMDSSFEQPSAGDWPTEPAESEAESRVLSKEKLEEEEAAVQQQEIHLSQAEVETTLPASPESPTMLTGNEEDGSNKEASISPAASSNTSPPLPFCPRVDDEEAVSLRLGVLSPLSLKSSSSSTNSVASSSASSPKSPIFSALQAPMSPVQAGESSKGFSTLLTPDSPTSTYDSTPYSPTLEELPPLPPLPPLRWRGPKLFQMEKLERDILPSELPTEKLKTPTLEMMDLRRQEAVLAPVLGLIPDLERNPVPVTCTESSSPVQEQLDVPPAEDQQEGELVVTERVAEPEKSLAVPKVEMSKPKELEVEPVSPAAVMEFPDEHMESVQQQRELPHTMMAEFRKFDAPEAPLSDLVPDVPGAAIQKQAPEKELPAEPDISDAPEAPSIESFQNTGSPDVDMEEASKLSIPAAVLQDEESPELPVSDAPMEHELGTLVGVLPEQESPKACSQLKGTTLEFLTEPQPVPNELELSVPKSVALDNMEQYMPDEMETKQEFIPVETEKLSETAKAQTETEPATAYTISEVLQNCDAREEAPSVGADQACESQTKKATFLEMARPEPPIAVPTIVKPELSLYPDARLLAPTSGRAKRDVTGVMTPKVPPKAPKLESPDVILPVSTMSTKDPVDDALIQAIALHDRSKLKKVASDLRPLKAPDERNVLLEQIRSQSFNLRHTVTEKKEKKEEAQPRLMTNINVAAILEKANAIRQAFVGSDDEDDGDWSDD